MKSEMASGPVQKLCWFSLGKPVFSERTYTCGSFKPTIMCQKETE